MDRRRPGCRGHHRLGRGGGRFGAGDGVPMAGRPARAAPRSPSNWRRAEQARRPWIWLYHWPPDGSPTCWTGQRHYGDADVTAWIAEHQPDVVLTGHVHQPPFREDGAWADRLGDSWVFNPGRQPGPVPAHVIVDLDEGVAEWWSLAGAEPGWTRLRSAPARARV